MQTFSPQAANTTNMWIFSNGANIGASKIIGDAVDTEVKERIAFSCHLAHSGFQRETLGLFSKVPPPPSSTATPHLNFIGVLREDMIKYADQLGAESKVCSTLILIEILPNIIIMNLH